jgi:hypothetical protein
MPTYSRVFEQTLVFLGPTKGEWLQRYTSLAEPVVRHRYANVFSLRCATYLHPSAFAGARSKNLSLLRGLLSADLPAGDSQPGCLRSLPCSTRECGQLAVLCCWRSGKQGEVLPKLSAGLSKQLLHDCGSF